MIFLLLENHQKNAKMKYQTFRLSKLVLVVNKHFIFNEIIFIHTSWNCLNSSEISSAHKLNRFISPYKSKLNVTTAVCNSVSIKIPYQEVPCQLTCLSLTKIVNFRVLFRNLHSFDLFLSKNGHLNKILFSRIYIVIRYQVKKQFI